MKTGNNEEFVYEESRHGARAKEEEEEEEGSRTKGRDERGEETRPSGEQTKRGKS